MKSSVSSKGQVTLPAAVRRQLGLVPGTAVQFELRETDVVLRKGTTGDHPVDRVYGTLQLGKRVDALLRDMRGPAPGSGRGHRAKSRKG